MCLLLELLVSEDLLNELSVLRNKHSTQHRISYSHVLTVLRGTESSLTVNHSQSPEVTTSESLTYLPHAPEITFSTTLSTLLRTSGHSLSVRCRPILRSVDHFTTFALLEVSYVSCTICILNNNTFKLV